MLYTDFVYKAMNETIVQADNGLYYLEPLWRSILRDNELFFSSVSDFGISSDELEDILKLEVKKRNTIASPKPFIEDWLFELISSEVEPAMLQEETNYIQRVMEFMKTNHELKMNSGDTDGDEELGKIVPFPTKE